MNLSTPAVAKCCAAHTRTQRITPPGARGLVTGFIFNLTDRLNRCRLGALPSTRSGKEVATILVMDDDPMVRTVIARILTVRGYRVLEAGSADEGLTLCAALGDTLDLLIAEPALPSLSEQPLADRVLRRCPAAKILYISAWPPEIVGWRQGLLQPSNAAPCSGEQVPSESGRILVRIRTVASISG